MSTLVTRAMIASSITNAELKKRFEKEAVDEYVVTGDDIIDQFQSEIYNSLDTNNGLKNFLLIDDTILLGEIFYKAIGKDTTLVCIDRHFTVDNAIAKFKRFYCVIQDGKLASPSLGLLGSDLKKSKKPLSPFRCLASDDRLSNNDVVNASIATFRENILALVDDNDVGLVSSEVKKIMLTVPFSSMFNAVHRDDTLSCAYGDFATEVDAQLSGCHDALSLRSEGMLIFSTRILKSTLFNVIDAMANTISVTVLHRMTEQRKSKNVQSVLGDIWGSW